MQAETVLTELGETYLEKFNSIFYGMLHWSDLDDLWQTLERKTSTQTDNQWYIYDLSEQPPQIHASGPEILSFIKNIDTWLRETHLEKYCGVVYADDKDNPTYIKIYHPKRMGYGVCSLAKDAPLPGWVISTLKPSDLNQARPANSSWWKKFPLISNQI
jgi:hypothetical protein